MSLRDERGGFRMPPRTVKFEFGEDTPYHGAVVRMSRKAPLEVALRLQGQMQSEDTEDRIAAIRYMGDTLIHDWNLEDDEGEVIPVSGASLLQQDMDFGFELLAQWLKAVNSVPTIPPAA